MQFTITISDQAVAEDQGLLGFAVIFQIMANRMSVSHFKYGDMADKYPDNAKAIDNVRTRLDLYERDGNVEHLIDAANFAAIEHLYPSHPEAHLESGDEMVKSPGLVYRDDG